MKYGYCDYHEIECDYKDGCDHCVTCPHNTKEDIKWFKKMRNKKEKKKKKGSNKNEVFSS